MKRSPVDTKRLREYADNIALGGSFHAAGVYVLHAAEDLDEAREWNDALAVRVESWRGLLAEARQLLAGVRGVVEAQEKLLKAIGERTLGGSQARVEDAFEALEVLKTRLATTPEMDDE